MTHHKHHDEPADRKAGAGAYKADQTETAHVGTSRVESGRSDRRPPVHLHLGPNREFTADYRQLGLAAGALGLGYLAFKGVSALLGRGVKTEAVAAGHSGRLEPVPLAESPTPEVKDNAAPRFNAEGSPNRVDEQRPFMAAPDGDDTAGLVVEVEEVDVVVVDAEPADRSAETAEHVPTDLMGDRPPSANDRAIDAFRPDPTAPVPEEMRDSLRPATGTAPGFAATRGTFASGLSQTDESK